LSTDFQPSASVVAVVVAFFVLVTPVPVGPPLLVRGAVPLDIRLTFIGPIRTPVALLTGVPVVIVSALLIVVAVACTVISVAIISTVVISICTGLAAASGTATGATSATQNEIVPASFLALFIISPAP
jgi:hypothetical protein